MASIKFDKSDLTDIRQFYQEELDRALKRLQHITSVLEQLGDQGALPEMDVKLPASEAKPARRGRKPKAVTEAAEVKVPAKRGRKPKAEVEVTEVKVPAKRGRKPKAVAETTEEKAPAKRGRKPKAVTEVAEVKVPAKRGRKPKIATETAEVKTPAKRGRKPKAITEVAEVKVPAKRGRKPKIATETAEVKTPAKRGRKPKAVTEAAEVKVPAKRGRKPGAVAKEATAGRTPRKSSNRPPWENIMTHRLQTLGKPMTYDQLTDDILNYTKLSESRRKTTKQSITQVVFRLRKKGEGFDTFSLGKKEKYIALKEWFDEKGVIRDEYKNRAEE